MKARKLMLEGKLPSESEEDAGVRAAYGFSVAGNAKPYFKYEVNLPHINYFINVVKAYVGEGELSSEINDDIVLGFLGHILWALGNGDYALQGDIVSERMMKSLGIKEHKDYFKMLDTALSYTNLEILKNYNELKNQATRTLSFMATKIIEDMDNDVSLVKTFMSAMEAQKKPASEPTPEAAETAPGSTEILEGAKELTAAPVSADGVSDGGEPVTPAKGGGSGVSRLRKKRRNTRRRNTRRRRRSTRRKNTRRRNTRRKNTRRRNTRRRY